MAKITRTGSIRRTKGAQFPADKTSAYGKALLALGRKLKNNVTPDDIIGAARRANSPFHDFFNWNDRTAAEQARRAQARHLITHIEVEYKYPDGTRCFHPVFYNISVTVTGKDEESGETVSYENRYVEVQTVSSDESLRKGLLNDELKTIRAAVQRIRNLVSMEGNSQLKVVAVGAFEDALGTLKRTLSR